MSVGKRQEKDVRTRGSELVRARKASALCAVIVKRSLPFVCFRATNSHTYKHTYILHDGNMSADHIVSGHKKESKSVWCHKNKTSTSAASAQDKPPKTAASGGLKDTF